MNKQQVVTLTQKFVFGPAMTALNDKQRAFVIALNNAGGQNATEAGRSAGYKDGPHLRQQCYMMLHDPRIQAAIREDVSARLTGNLAQTFDLIERIAQNPQHNKQLDALKFQAHHAGMIEKKVVEHTGDVTLSFEQKLDRAKQLAQQAGLDPEKELAGIIDITPTSVIIDAEEPDTW